jgi:hypothetical protein
MQDFNKISHEDILIRWVNFHLREAGQVRFIANLGTDISNSEAMIYVLHNFDKSEPLFEEDPQQRADHMIEQSKLIGVPEICQGFDLTQGNTKVNTIFIASVFNTIHGRQINQ